MLYNFQHTIVDIIAGVLTSYAEGTSRLHHTTGVIKAHFNGRADFIGLNGDHAVHQRITHLGKAEE